jgi:dTDP-4-dehydrorhamnose reductase
VIEASSPTFRAPLELWGSHEAVVARLAESWYDQAPRTGHEDRLDDLALFADVGIRRLRYPALWERIAPRDGAQPDFAWTDHRLAEMRRLGTTPVLTLCRHGGTPNGVSLLDEGFASGLARHAGAVAARYPWVEDYTPVAEPLTSARFSALYGHWYPQERGEHCFWRALLNQVDATRAAMRAIRAINPSARLIQTEDLEFVHATAPLQAEAAGRNERRWSGWDLLCGLVVPGHALWDRLVALGFTARLRAIADDPCPPDVVSINHSPHSERLLDHRPALHVGAGAAARRIARSDGLNHVDVDARPCAPDRLVGLAGLVRQAWDRYRRPIAVNCSLGGSTRDEQARLLVDTWDSAEALRARGVEVCAITAPALLGSYDWTHIATRTAGHYVPGVFDVRAGCPRPTLLAAVLKDLAHGRRPAGPGVSMSGWWSASRHHARAAGRGPRSIDAPDRLLILGAGGVLAQLAVAACEARGLDHVVARDRPERAITAARAWAVLDAREGIADTPHAHASLADLCRQRGIIGAAFVPGRTRRQRSEPANLLVVETGPVFAATDDDAGVVRMFDALDMGENVLIDPGEDWDAVYGPSLIDGVLDLLLDRVTGVVQFLPEQGWSASDVARVLARLAHRDPACVAELRAPHALSAQDSASVSYLPPLDICLERFAADRRIARAARLEPLMAAAE